MSSKIKSLGMFVAGVAIGVGAGILMAPNSGKKTRKKLLDESRKVTYQFSDTLSKKLDTVKTSYNKRLDDYAKSGKTVIEGAKDTLKI
jgi:gas vesicle protein